MGAGAGLALAGWLPAGLAAAAAAPEGGARPDAISPEAARKRLQEGNERYAANQPNEKDFSSGRAARASAQYPIAAILSCADSRVAPELVFDQGPGELFVVRVAGNALNNDLLASLEYGVEILGIPLIVVLGHSGCGAVDAAIKVLKKDAKLPGHLPELIRAIKPAVLSAEKMKTGTLLDNAIAENVRRNVAALKRANPIIARAYAGKKIDVVGAVYDLATGRVTPA
ncbi:MAG: carbonic anhydrase [Casimicrobiaceae bacterium]